MSNLYFLANQTNLTMNANSTATTFTKPPVMFILFKLSQTQLLNVLKIFDHAHFVFCPVPFVKLFQPFTWKHLTVITEF